MRIYLYKIVIICILSLFACSRETQEPFNISHNILHELRTHIPEATQIINFQKNAHPEKFLSRGWAIPEEDYTWSKAKESLLWFYAYGVKTDIETEISCRAIPAVDDNAKQLTEVSLNNQTVTSFVVRPDQVFHKVNLTLPASVLISGQNLLQFKFSYTTKPATVWGSEFKKDKRNLALAFKEITFKKNNKLSVEDRGLLQYANSHVEYFLELPAIFELEVQYQSIKGANSSIELSRENNKKIIVPLPGKNETYKKRFQLKQKGIYKMHLVTKGPSESHTFWTKIQANIYEEQKIEKSKNQVYSRISKPDILLYVVDTLRSDHLGCYGYQRDTSPNIDQFARENALYMNAYSSSSWTKPAAASIYTGLLSKNHKTMTKEDKLPDELVTLAELLRENGYHTIAISAHGFIGTPSYGLDQGFDELIMLSKERDPVTGPIVFSDKVNERIFDFYSEYLNQKERKPFFLLVWTVDPHAPYTPCENVKNLFSINQYTPIDTYTYNIKFLRELRTGNIRPTPSQIEYIKTRYDQEIYFNDNSFGVLLDKMKEHGIYDESLIIFTSDHGEEFFEHGGFGHGQSLYNEVIRIPFIIKTTSIEPGEYQERIQLNDIYPTILDILGKAEPYKLDGKSLMHHTPFKRTLYLELGSVSDSELARLDCNWSAIIFKDKKLMYTENYTRQPSKQHVSIFELYDINDVYEQNNLNFSNFEDKLRLQKLFTFLNSGGSTDFKTEKTVISPEMNQHLRDLGYVK